MRRREREHSRVIWDTAALLLALGAAAAAGLALAGGQYRRFLVPGVFAAAALVNAIFAADCLTPDDKHRVNRAGAVTAVVTVLLMAGLAVASWLILKQG